MCSVYTCVDMASIDSSGTHHTSEHGDVSVGVKGKGGGVEMNKERMKVLAVDHALRRETYRASQLSHELQKMSIKRDSPTPLLSPGCVYKVSYIVACSLYFAGTLQVHIYNALTASLLPPLS